ncbi:MAG: hypothetical protein PT119_24355 [Aphanizomenon gracile PMC627.10]|uniref:hypothetical protein n=1 Tax=Dolichospermum sp. LEGE 00240 TaxID=1828603 RepID=UPI00187EBDA9|nr:hypothetical protein [Dolichospermum sp. LEGE 00240]MDM3853024.1 hypothetical protein [Aphanizomenon gracile PMC627.10]
MLRDRPPHIAKQRSHIINISQQRSHFPHPSTGCPSLPKKRTACSSASLSPFPHPQNSELLAAAPRYRPPTSQKKRSLISQDDNYQITEHL